MFVPLVGSFGFDTTKINSTCNDDMLSLQKDVLCPASDRGCSVPPVGFGTTEISSNSIESISFLKKTLMTLGADLVRRWGRLARRNARSAWNPPPLPYGKRWRVRSKAQVRNCKSQICRSLTPLKSPPSAPAHSARPPQNVRPPGFCDFHFARHSPSEMQNNCRRRILM